MRVKDVRQYFCGIQYAVDAFAPLFVGKRLVIDVAIVKIVTEMNRLRRRFAGVLVLSVDHIHGNRIYGETTACPWLNVAFCR